MHIAWTPPTRTPTRTRSRRAGAVVGVACLLWAPAASASEPAPKPEFSLSVSPTRLVVPSAELDQPHYLQVTDTGSLPIDVSVRKAAFVQLKDGSPSFRPDAPYSAVTWVSVVPDRFHLEPGTGRQVTLQITVPELPEVGDHQLALVSSVAAPDTGSNIRISRGIGVALYITIPGDIDDSVSFTDFHAPPFALDGPINFSATVHDTGTVHHGFEGPDRLGVSVGGGKVMFPDFLVTRGATRVMTARWTNPPFICVCHATASITGADGQAHQVATTVVVFPFHLFAGAVAALIALYIVYQATRRRFHQQVMAEADRMSRGGDDPVD